MTAAGRALNFLRAQRKSFHAALYLAGAYSSWKLFNEHFYESASCGGPSMYPTLHFMGDSLVISKRHRYGRGIAVGDIVVYKQPQFSHMISAKRVLGMPGDYVVLDIRCGEEDTAADEQSDMIQVPEGHMWVTGDNLPFSRDSREYGPVPLSLVTGKAIGRLYWLIAWPRYERIENPFEKAPADIP